MKTTNIFTRLAPKLLGLTVLLACAAPGHAAFVSFDNAAAFLAAAGPLGSEDFNSQVDGTSFHTTPLDVGAFTLSMTGPARTDPGRNQIDAPPAQLSSFNIDGTTVANVLTVAGTSLFLTFDNPITSFGASLAAFNDDLLRTEIHAGGATFLPAPSSGDILRFFGVVSDTAFSTVEFRGLEDDGFAMDNVLFGSTAPTVPEPATLALLGLGLAGLRLRRGRPG